jgi:hypothetical protein
MLILNNDQIQALRSATGIFRINEVVNQIYCTLNDIYPDVVKLYSKQESISIIKKLVEFAQAYDIVDVVVLHQWSYIRLISKEEFYNWPATFGPWGIAAWAVVGTALSIGATVGVIELGKLIREDSKAKTGAIPKTGAITETQECPNCKRFVLRVQAQGKDCGGNTHSTITPPAIVQPTPVSVQQALLQSAVTKAMLNRTQLTNRELQIPKAEEYIRKGPANGGYLGKKSFTNPKLRGGIRYDVDCEGDGRSLIY